MKSRFFFTFFLTLLLMASIASAENAIKQLYFTKKTSLNYPATYTFRLSLWDSEAEGNEAWSEEKPIRLSGATLKTYLGDVISLEAVDFSEQYWVQVERRKGDGTYVLIGERDMLEMVPYALWSATSSESVIPGSHTHSADEITSDTLDDTRFSAYSDLSSEGYLDDNANSDLLTRVQADGRYVNEGQSDSVSSAMIQTGAVTDSKITGPISSSKIDGTGLNADTLDGTDSSGFALTDHTHDIYADGRYVNEDQSDSISSAMIQTGAVTDSKITGPISSSKIDGIDLNADTLDGIDSTGYALTDHTHDIYVDLSTNQAVGGTKTFSDSVVSTVVTGTPPLQVASSTMVTNLNSEMVGGYAVADLDARYGQKPPAQNSRANTVTSVDSGGFVGLYTSIAIGSDGLPIISYYDATNFDLKVAKCGNPSCSSGNTMTTVDSGGQVGTYTSILMGTDELPIISYYDPTNGDLKVVKCGHASCSGSNTITTIDSAGDVGAYSSLTVGLDGLPVISYYDFGNGNLKVVKCGNPSCTAANTITTLDSTGDVGLHTSIALGTDGLPIISYYDLTGANLKVVKCGNPSCSSGNTVTALDSTGDVGSYTSITIGTDSFPLISYYDTTNANLKVVKCGNAACSAGNTITALDSTGDVGSYTSMSVSLDGFPVISYYDGTNFDLKIVRCGNTACTSGNTVATVDSGGFAGTYTSITIGTDGLPIVSFYDGSNGDLKVAKCGNTFCLNNWGRR